MRARTLGLSVLALGILIGAGGCSSESPTSPLAPSTASKGKTASQDTATVTASGGYVATGNRREQPGTVTTAGGYVATGN